MGCKMISLAQLMRDNQQALQLKHGAKMKARHYTAMHAIMDCHTEERGKVQYHCQSCENRQNFCRSCGNRSCPSCQHQTNNQWLDRQRKKLLPVDYYMITFTIPRELRQFVWHHQEWAYQAMMKAAAETLQSFYQMDKKLLGKAGLTAVLHTHSRKLDFHPHIHFIAPNGGFNRKQLLWRQKSGKYLFKEKNLATVFRGKFIEAMVGAGFYVPSKMPRQWIVNCTKVGKGEPALVYLARYLYRGVVSEKNILSCKNGRVTFRYKDSDTKQWKTRNESVADFLWLVLQHVLPKGFRRTRDYGFLHGNAKKTLLRIQLKLRVNIPEIIPAQPKVVACKCCGFAMQFVGLLRRSPQDVALPT